MTCIDTEKLRALRAVRRWNTIEAAERAGVSQAMYSYFEQGLRTPKVEALINIAKMYGVTLDELVRKD